MDLLCADLRGEIVLGINGRVLVVGDSRGVMCGEGQDLPQP